jgi:hypothetical protein
MCFERFLCYIVGGKVEGMRVTCEGCRDKTHPIKSQRVSIPHTLYFAEDSMTWGGGVAFLHPSKDEEHSTIGRMYLITVNQFQEVVAQENGALSGFVDLKKVSQKKILKVSDGWYGHVMHIGDHEGYPILTFSNNLEKIAVNPPNDSYIRIISTGLKQMELDHHTIVQYLQNKQGVKDHYHVDKLHEIVRSSPANLEFHPLVPQRTTFRS